MPSRAPLAFVVLAVAAACARDTNATPAPPFDAAAYATSWERWKAGRDTFLLAPGRPLSYTGLTWLRQGRNTIGAARTNMVVLPGRGVPPALGVLVRSGDTVRFEPAPAAFTARLTVDSQPLAGAVASNAVALRTDADKPRPSRVEVGSAGFRIIKRVDSVGVRAWDAEHPAVAAMRKAPTRLAYFPLDTAWRFPARFVPAARVQRIAVMTESGVAEEHDIVGTTEVRVGDSTYALTTFAGTGPTDLYFVFTDGTSGDETYGFRFLHAPLDTVAKTTTLDFNFAYNPECAFSAYTTCPLPPRANHIKARLLAGERAFHHDSIR